MAAEDLAPGKWNLSGSDNFDDYLQTVGVNFALRKIAAHTKSEQHISVDGGQWTIDTISTFKNHSITFRPGQEVSHETPDGRKVKSTFKVSGNKLIEDQKGDPNSTITRTFQSDKFVMELICKGATAYRHYSKF